MFPCGVALCPRGCFGLQTQQAAEPCSIARAGDFVSCQAVNVVVAEELDIPPETASRLVNLGRLLKSWEVHAR